MKVTTRLLYIGLMLTALFMMSSLITSAQTSDGLFRFVHVVPGVSEVDIYTDGQLTISGLDYGEGTDYINVPAGDHEVTVNLHGQGTSLWSQNVTVDATPLTLLASNTQSPIFEVYNDNLQPLALGQSRFTLIHAIANGPNISVSIGDSEVAPDFAYPQVVGTFDVPAGFYSLSANTGAGATVYSGVPFNQNTGESQFLILYGTSEAPEFLALEAAVSSNDGGLVRIAHTVAGAPDVDIYANDTMIVSGLSFGSATPHLPIPAGTYNVDVRIALSEESLLQTELTVEDGNAITVAAIGTADAPSLSVFSDDLSGVSPDTAVITAINTIPGNSTVIYSLDDGTSITSGIAFGESDLPVSISPTVEVPSIDFSVDGQSATLEQEEVAFYGGVYYNAIAVTGSTFSPPLILFFPTSLSQGIASAPALGSSIEVVEVQSEVSTPEPAQVTQPTQVPADTQPTQVPVVAPTVPTSLEEEPLPTARILLDPGVNLQLRQYPSTEALSLGLAPSGGVVIVNGRFGPPIDILTGEEIVAEGEEPFVDPATLLEDEEADLLPEETWINFTYPTPDGGTISAWTLALYLDIRDEENEPVRLADLPLIPNNQAGVASNTDITPPPVQVDRVTAVVINLDVTANLNMRRTPDAAGEVLARLPVGTVVDLLGVLETRDWAFVGFSPAEGGTITGWVSTQFIDYQLNGELSNLDEIDGFGLLTIISGDTIGQASAGIPGVSQPTPDPERDAYVAEVVLDPGANLNLRRTPDAQAEVIARIPTGTRLIITGRTADSTWLLTTFENQQGWIATGFVVISFNEEFVEDLTVIPLAPGQ